MNLCCCVAGTGTISLQTTCGPVPSGSTATLTCDGTSTTITSIPYAWGGLPAGATYTLMANLGVRYSAVSQTGTVPSGALPGVVYAPVAPNFTCCYSACSLPICKDLLMVLTSSSSEMTWAGTSSSFSGYSTFCGTWTDGGTAPAFGVVPDGIYVAGVTFATGASITAALNCPTGNSPATLATGTTYTVGAWSVIEDF